MASFLRLNPVADVNVTGDGTWHRIKWSVAEASTDWSLVSQTEITCLTAGLYHVSASAYMTGGSSTNEGSAISLNHIPNGGAEYGYFRSFTYDRDTYTLSAALACAIELGVGDVLRIYCRGFNTTKIYDGPGPDTRYSRCYIGKLG